jgi:hypothetical protein
MAYSTKDQASISPRCARAMAIGRNGVFFKLQDAYNTSNALTIPAISELGRVISTYSSSK